MELIIIAALLFLGAARAAIWADRMRGTAKADGRKGPKWIYAAVFGAAIAYMLRPEVVAQIFDLAVLAIRSGFTAGWIAWEAGKIAAWFGVLATTCALGACVGGWGNIVGPILTDTPPMRTSLRIHPDNPTGPKVEKDEREKFAGIIWQRGVFLRSAPLAALARGFIWGGCMTPAALMDERALLLPPIFAVAFAAGPYLARWYLGGPLNQGYTGGSPAWATESQRSNDMWALSEEIRAAVVSVLIFAALLSVWVLA